MSFSEICGLSLIRCVVIALLAGPICVLLERLAQQTSARRQKWIWMVIGLQAFFAGLMTGYAYG